MPDWWKSTLRAESFAHLSNDARIVGLIEAIADLRSLDRRLAILGASLPEQGQQFDWHAELRLAIECVRHDLLEDALETLLCAAISSPTEHYSNFLQRERETGTHGS